MSDFVLVDLESQAEAFVRYTEGWKPDEIVDWLARHGELNKFPDGFGGYFNSFRSAVGITAGFVFDKDGELVLILDHTTFKPSAPRKTETGGEGKL